MANNTQGEKEKKKSSSFSSSFYPVPLQDCQPTNHQKKVFSPSPSSFHSKTFSLCWGGGGEKKWVWRYDENSSCDYYTHTQTAHTKERHFKIEKEKEESTSHRAKKTFLFFSSSSPCCQIVSAVMPKSGGGRGGGVCYAEKKRSCFYGDYKSLRCCYYKTLYFFSNSALAGRRSRLPLQRRDKKKWTSFRQNF